MKTQCRRQTGVLTYPPDQAGCVAFGKYARNHLGSFSKGRALKRSYLPFSTQFITKVLLLLFTVTGTPICPVIHATSNGLPDKPSVFSNLSTPPPSGIVSVRVSSSSDDAEQEVDNGDMDLSSSDLELIEDGDDQIVGMRFNNITIPQGAIITAAYVEFEGDEDKSDLTSLIISGEDTDHALTFNNTDYNISDRTQTSAVVAWPLLPEWEKDIKYQSPDIAIVVQEIVNRPGWSSGNSMAIMIEGFGKRTAEAYDGEEDEAPLLVIHYIEAVLEICDNNIDDDGDGLTDCADPDCGGTPVVDLGTDADICVGESVDLAPVVSGYVGLYSFNWSHGLGTGPTVNVSPLSTTTYSVTVTGDNGCSSTDNVTLTVHDLPTVAVTGSSPVCSGTNTTITATPSGGSGPYIFNWSHGLSDAASHSVAPVTTTTYTVTVTDLNGCTATGALVVDVDPAPSIATSGDVTVCEATNVVISANPSGGTAPYTLSWSHGLGSGTSYTVIPASTTTYSVTATDDNGCTAVETMTITVSTTPTADAGTDETICRFTSTTLTATVSGGSAPYSYTWDNGLGSGDIHTVTPVNATTYTVTVTSTNGCIGTDQVTITPITCVEICNNGLDDDLDGLADCDDPDCGPVVDLGPDMNMCIGGSTTLVANLAGGWSPSYTFEWSHGLGFGAIKTVSPLATTTYSVTVTAPGGCSSVENITVNVVATCPENCTDGLDNDGDGLVDCDDPDCTGIASPILVDDSYTSCPGMPFSQRVTYNDSNLNDPAFSIAVNPSQGTVTIDATGKFYYTPFTADCTSDQFVYQVCNQTNGCCSEATVTIDLGDATPPVLTNVPSDITLNCDETLPAPAQVLAFEECPGVFLSFDEVSAPIYGGACGSYVVTRTWSATDYCGNEASAVQNITVLDQTNPEIFQVYTLDNGKRLVAGVSQRVSDEWKYIPFPITFDETPMIFTTVVSESEVSAVAVRQRNAYSQGFEMALFEQEGADGQHLPEMVAWIAIESGTNIGDVGLEAGRWSNVGDQVASYSFSELFGNDPGLLTSIQSSNDIEPVNFRFTGLTGNSLQAFLQEEASADPETAHGYEHVGYMAFTAGENLRDFRNETFGETGKINLTNAWTTITLDRTYTKPVVMAGGISNNESDPVNVRVRNVTQNSFQIRLQEWDYLDGNHAPESVSWMVMEGAIPGNQGYYCAGNSTYLQTGVNIFAIDNCDAQVAFGYSETPTLTETGTMTTRTWSAIDDCGNINVTSRFDTCNTAALQVKAMLYGALTNSGNTGLMRDNLRASSLVPIREPYSSLPGFPHVEDPQAPEEEVAEEPVITYNGEDVVTICHMHGTPDEATLVVPESALALHLAHGDVLGECSSGSTGLPAGAANATYKSAADGNWLDAATWEGGNVPPFKNISNISISITHHVTLYTEHLSMKANVNLWVTNGSLTLTEGKIDMKSSNMVFKDADLYLPLGELVLADAGCTVTMQNSTVDIGGKFENNDGMRWLENVCINAKKFDNKAGLDTLLNLYMVLEGDVGNKDGGSMYLKNAHFSLDTGSFVNDLACTITGSDLKIWAPIGGIQNYGIWNAGVAQYCTGFASAGVLSTLLPTAEDCAGMPDYFVPGYCLIPDEPVVSGGNGGSETNNEPTPAEIAAPGTLDPLLMTIEGDNAIVDWLLLELRNPDDDDDIKAYSSVALLRNGEVVTEDGDPLINFPGVAEGEYFVCIRHRNHLGLMTDSPVYLSTLDPPLVDFTDLSLQVRGGNVAGRTFGALRAMWAGDFNEDGKIIYQGPNNDVFYLFSRVLADESNVEFLANYIVEDYSLSDLNMDGKVIYQGPNNDRAPLLYHSVLSHAANHGFLANFIVEELLP